MEDTLYVLHFKNGLSDSRKLPASYIYSIILAEEITPPGLDNYSVLWAFWHADKYI